MRFLNQECPKIDGGQGFSTLRKWGTDALAVLKTTKHAVHRDCHFLLFARYVPNVAKRSI